MYPTLISVDCEYTGQAISNGELLTIAAVALEWDENGGIVVPPLQEIARFDMNLMRVNMRSEPGTMTWWEDYPAQWCRATEDAKHPGAVMHAFNTWLKSFNNKLLFCAWPAAADWQYVNSYLWQYCNENPFGYSPFCLKNYALGKCNDFAGVLGHRHDTTMPPEWNITPEEIGLTSHVALHDAYAQAHMLARIITA